MDWLRRTAGQAGRFIGDDAALLPGDLAVTLDHQIAGVHFPEGLDAARIGRRLLAVNLSDLAAVGARPEHAFLALAAPLDFDRRRLLAALSRDCARHRISLSGGDLSIARQVTLSLTLLGSRPAHGRWLERRNASPGDVLWIGGLLGASAVGRHLLQAGARTTARGVELPPAFRSPTGLSRAARAAVGQHLLPRPQLRLSRWLARRRRAAAIDLSDGLALDLHRLCRASDVGATIDLGTLPSPPRFDQLCRLLGRDPGELTLHGGEDYVLLFALSPGLRPPGELECRAIGRIRSGNRVLIREGDAERLLDAAGWDHLRHESEPPVSGG